MVRTLIASTALAILGLLVSDAHAADQGIPAKARKVVLEKAATGYRWNLIETAMPKPAPTPRATSWPSARA
jgi:hypothetical protein